MGPFISQRSLGSTILGLAIYFGALSPLLAAKNVTPPDSRHSTSIRFDLQKNRRSIERLRAQESFPALFPDSKVYLSGNKLSKAAISSEVQAKLDELQKVVFRGREVLKLIACDGCEPNIEVGTLKVFIDPKWIDSILNDKRFDVPMTVIHFVLAHEISHYVYESEIASSARRLSPNEQKSYFFVRLPDDKFVQSLMALPEGAPKTELLKEAILEETARHAEIDSLAKVLLDTLGVKSQCDVVKWLRSWTNVPEDLERAIGGIGFTRINSFKNLLGDSCH